MTTPPRSSRLRRLSLWLVAVGFGLFAAWGLLVASAEGYARHELRQRLEERLGVPVSVGGVDLQPLRGRVRVRGLWIAQPTGFEGGGALLSIDQAEAEVVLRSLRSDVEIRIPRIEIAGVRGRFERLADGRTNIRQVAAHEPAALEVPEPAPPAAEEPPAPASGPPPAEVETEPEPNEPERREPKPRVVIGEIRLADWEVTVADWLSEKDSGEARFVVGEVALRRLEIPGVSDREEFRAVPETELELAGLLLEDPEQFGPGAMLAVPSLRASFDLARTRAGEPAFSLIEADGVRYTLASNERGRLNRKTLDEILDSVFKTDNEDDEDEEKEEAPPKVTAAPAPSPEPAEAQPAPAAETAPVPATEPAPRRRRAKPRDPFRLDRLVLRDAVFDRQWWDDEAEAWQRAGTGSLVLELTGLRAPSPPGRPFALTVRASPLSDRGHLTLTAEGVPYPDAPASPTLTLAISGEALALHRYLAMPGDDEDEQGPSRVQSAWMDLEAQGQVAGGRGAMSLELAFSDVTVRPDERSFLERLRPSRADRTANDLAQAAAEAPDGRAEMRGESALVLEEWNGAFGPLFVLAHCAVADAFGLSDPLCAAYSGEEAK
ncbi:MAG: hypothetical protein RLY93_15485 [Sumerlaeia bacterium]